MRKHPLSEESMDEELKKLCEAVAEYIAKYDFGVKVVVRPYMYEVVYAEDVSRDKVDMKKEHKKLQP